MSSVDRYEMELKAEGWDIDYLNDVIGSRMEDNETLTIPILSDDRLNFSIVKTVSLGAQLDFSGTLVEDIDDFEARRSIYLEVCPFRTNIDIVCWMVDWSLMTGGE